MDILLKWWIQEWISEINLCCVEKPQVVWGCNSMMSINQTFYYKMRCRVLKTMM